ncbi:MAG: hypothetical protein PHV53_06860 [Fermentimonas sp.]|nr:hypothetical protein [Fermentimonas sp.]
MKRLLIVVLCSFCLFGLKAQFRLDYHASYASYNMSDMSDLMQTIKSGEPFKSFGMEIVEDFPAYIAHSVNVGYRLNRHEFGIKSGYYSTGGKISVGDYSGKINVALTTNGYREGLYYRNYLYTFKDRFSLWGEVSPAIIISTLNIETVLTDVDISEVMEEADYNMNAYSVLLQLGGKYYINRVISLDLSGGYEISSRGQNDRLIGSPRPDWSGLRLTGGVGFSF